MFTLKFLVGICIVIGASALATVDKELDDDNFRGLKDSDDEDFEAANDEGDLDESRVFFSGGEFLKDIYIIFCWFKRFLSNKNLVIFFSIFDLKKTIFI